MAVTGNSLIEWLGEFSSNEDAAIAEHLSEGVWIVWRYAPLETGMGSSAWFDSAPTS